MTLVTVVVAAFDVDPYLSRCLDSILRQTTQDIEVVVVDDGSTDATGEIADRYSNLDPRLRVVHQRNGGLSAARNTGLNSAQGEFIVFIDGDDWVDPHLAERMTAHARATAADVVVAGRHVDTHDTRDRLLRSVVQVPRRMVLSEERPLRTEEADAHFVNLVGYAWNKLYRRELLVMHELYFEEGLSLIEDVVFNGSALAHASRVAFLDEAFVHYVQRPRSTLGTRPYPEFMTLRLRGIESTQRILTSLGVPESDVVSQASKMSVSAVIGAVRSSATRSDLQGRRRSRALQRMIEHPDAAIVLEMATKYSGMRTRDRLVLSLVSRSRYGLALLPVRVSARARLLHDRIRTRTGLRSPLRGGPLGPENGACAVR